MFFNDFSAEYKDLESILKNIQDLLKEEFAITAIMSFELEFFLLPESSKVTLSNEQSSEFLASVKEIALNHGLKIGSVTEEVGELQYEVNFKHGADLGKLAQDLLKTKEIIINIAKSYACKASFAAKPHGDKDVGSGMHTHLSFSDSDQENIFQEKNELFYQSIAGLLKNLPASMLFFITDQSDFARFSAKFSINKAELRYRCNATNAPVNISWGTNNRTTALRIPDSYQEPKMRRIEHRVPASNANPYLVLIGVLMGAYLGIKHKLQAPEKIWGNAFDEQYILEALPINLVEAKSAFANSEMNDFLVNLKNIN